MLVKNIFGKNLRATLLASTAIITVLSVSNAQAATELVNAQTYGPTDNVGGYIETTNGVTSVNFQTTANEYFVIGADNVNSVKINSDSGASLALNLTSSGTNSNSGIVFADDIVETSGNISINVNNGSVKFQGNVGQSNILAGNSTTPTDTLLTFENANNESLQIGSNIDRNGAGNTVNIKISNQSTSDESSITFTGDIGGDGNVDTITIADAGASNTNNVTFEGAVNANNINIGEEGGANQNNYITFDSPNSVSIAANITGNEADNNVLIIDNGASVNLQGVTTGIDRVDIADDSSALSINNDFTGGEIHLIGNDSRVELLNGNTYDSSASVINANIVGEGNTGSRYIIANNTDFTGNITLLGSNDTLQLQDNASINGNVSFGAGDDTLSSLGANNTISGTVDFGAGTDSFTVDDDSMSVTSAVTNLEYLQIGADGKLVLSSAITGLGEGSGVQLYDNAILQIVSGGSIDGNVYGDSGATLEFGHALEAPLEWSVASIESPATYNLAGTVNGVNLAIGGSATVNTNGHMLGHDQALRSIDVNGGGTFNVQDDVTAGQVHNAGTIEISSGKTLRVNDLYFNEGFLGLSSLPVTPMTPFEGDKKIIFDVASQDDHSLLNVTNNELDLTGATVEAKLTGVSSGYVDGGHVLVATSDGAVIGTDGNTGVDHVKVNDNSAFFDVFMSDGSHFSGSNDDLYLEFNQVATIKDIANDKNGKGVGSILDNLVGETEDENLNNIIDNIYGSNAAEANQIVDSLTLTADMSGVNGSQNFVNNTLDVTNERIASIQYDQTSMSAGNSGGLRAWSQVFGQEDRQSSHKGVAGYGVNTGGAAFGVDTESLVDNAIIGAVFSYGKTGVDSNNANRTATDINSYQLSLYGSYLLEDHNFVKAMAAYSLNDVKTTRSNVGGLGLTAKGDYNANIYTLRGEVGHDFKVADTRITPSLMTHFSNYSAQDYKEHGAGGANLNVSQDSLNLWEVGAGLETGWNLKSNDGASFAPELRAGYRYDLIGDNFNATTSFTGGGGSFNTQGVDPTRGTLSLGGGLTYYTTSAWELSANYEFEHKTDYNSNSGFLRAAYQF